MVARHVLTSTRRGPGAHSASASGNDPLASQTPARPSPGASLVYGLRRDRGADRLKDAAGMVIPNCSTDCASCQESRKSQTLFRAPKNCATSILFSTTGSIVTMIELAARRLFCGRWIR